MFFLANNLITILDKLWKVSAESKGSCNLKRSFIKTKRSEVVLGKEVENNSLENSWIWG